MSKLYALVMAGGRGTRFWPESTSKRPKQYLKLLGGDESLLETTLRRFEGLVPLEERYVITVKEQGELAQQSSTGCAAESGIIFEPSGRNTAPCIMLSLASLLANGASGDDVVSIVPSDHVILNEGGFRKVIAEAAEVARTKGMVVTIGIPPNFPHTGFGYINRGEELGPQVFKVKQFVEKPDHETAVEYLKTGDYYWNAGMFVSTIDTLLVEFKEHCPEVYEHFDALLKHANDFDKVSEIYSQIPKNSIDYAIMEKSDRIATVPARFDWNDLGSWDALEAVIDKTEANTLVASDGFHFEGAKGNVVYTPGKHVSLVNVEDLIVVVNDNAVVVLPKKDAQKVKSIVEGLQGTDLAEKLL
ncbi:MAG: mannose-1-phosphate guanylyltransferase [Bacteriovoracaceae bacterium]|nr:mannose-1-phosphate guanylyltransferase [Bacteriovoracaceae bacterium]